MESGPAAAVGLSLPPLRAKHKTLDPPKPATAHFLVELARFAEAWPGTRAAEDARRELQALKQEMP